MRKPSNRVPDKSDAAVIDHVADETGPMPGEPSVRSPTTPSGKPVEEQVRKEWEPNRDGGLPTFLSE